MSASFAPSHAPRQPVAPGVNVPVLAHVPGAPAGTFAPGTKVQVGGSRVVVEKYLSEGGFAHVYVVKLPRPVGGDDKAVLKRVAVPDKEALATMRTEVETMKKLKGHRKIVTYFDSHASQLAGGGYEVFLLMEYCSGGGLIDFMNTRLQNRLTEPEILKIFCDTAEGVACMHYLKPPLIHRDLKVENILISVSGGTKTFKLCDFGSAAPPRPAATTAAEGRLIEDDVQRHTTMQYRSPEMIDVYRKQPIDEKADIWALGVLLYKLCYYTTPFEEQGQMAILNASFKYPSYPPFSDRTKKLIAMMLQEKPQNRPNIYQVLREVCAMRGKDVPIKDIYSGRTASEARRNQELPAAPGTVSSPPVVGAYKAAPVDEKPVSLPEIIPMRRGRPTDNLGSDKPGAAKPDPSPRRVVSSDPFAALDSDNPSALDQVSSRFPSLDQFSLLHDAGNTFAFENSKPQPAPAKKAISQRVTEALADDAFATLAPAKKDIPLHSKSVPALSSRHDAGVQTAIVPPPSSAAHPSAGKSHMVSTGIQTSLPSPPSNNVSSSPYQKPIFRFPPSDKRSSSQPRAAPMTRQDSSSSQKDFLARPLLMNQRSTSQTNLSTPKQSSARPSMDSERPLRKELDDLGRSRSLRTRRPVSAHLETATRFLTRSPSKGNSGDEGRDNGNSNSTEAAKDGGEATRITSDVEFLRAMEEEEPPKKRDKRMSSGSKHSKRSSMPSISLSGTKSLLAGRFGEAFRRFETNTSPDAGDDNDKFPDSANLTPIDGSTATDGRSDDGQVVEETEEMPPEMRRELERRRLSQEERRVADAAAAYKQGLNTKGHGGGKASGQENNRAARIQNKVQALLDESNKTTTHKTAEGYGRFTASPAPLPGDRDSTVAAPSSSSPSSSIAVATSTSNSGIKPSLGLRKPQQRPEDQRQQNAPPSTLQPSMSSSMPSRSPLATSSAHFQPSTTTNSNNAPTSSNLLQQQNRPSAPPKPQALRTGGGIINNNPVTNTSGSPMIIPKPQNLKTGGGPRTPQTAIPNTTTTTNNSSNSSAPGNSTATDQISAEDWEASFSKKYPALSGLEMVETEIESGSGRGGGGGGGSGGVRSRNDVGYRDI